jgi:hypothetical protein
VTDSRPRYGRPHRRVRAWWKLQVERGEVDCARCGVRIEPGEEWDLGHVDGGGAREYAGPEHRRCNRATVTHLKGEAVGRGVDLSRYVDDPGRGVFWGPPEGGVPRRWSRAWFDWRAER